MLGATAHEEKADVIAPRPFVVAAASSLTDVMEDVAALYAAEGHVAPRFSFAATSELVRQIEQGAQVNHAEAGTGERPLHAAICRANDPRGERVVRVLLDGGADPNAATRPGQETGSFMRKSMSSSE
ncbi:MAG: hypothetical protein HC767_10910, partial [Akkermansiaceae bacterium]|nr:hypothetical protein [Akkermansiaceae bacterium]